MKKGGVPPLLHPDQAFFVRSGAVFYFVSHFPVKGYGGDGGGYLNALCPEEIHIRLQCADDGGADAAADLLRQHVDRQQDALGLAAPERRDRAGSAHFSFGESHIGMRRFGLF